MSKAEHELDVFRAFVAAAGLDVALDAVKAEDPPLPDVSCLLEGVLVYFELTRAAAQDIADDVGSSFRRARAERVVVGQMHPYSDRLILETAIGRKAAARHETNGRPLHLLVYYDGVFHAVGRLEVVEPIYRDLQGRFHDRWSAMWLFDQPTGAVISPPDTTTAANNALQLTSGGFMAGASRPPSSMRRSQLNAVLCELPGRPEERPCMTSTALMSIQTS